MLSLARAGASESIAANNANLQQQQSQEGAAGLGGMYKTDTSGMLDAMGQEKGDIATELAADAAPAPWMSQASNAMRLTEQAAKLAGRFGIPGFGGF